MKSLDHHINDPFHVDTLQQLRNIPSWDNPKIESVTQGFYDLIGKKDPNTIYIIIDSQGPSKKMYLGDMIISSSLLTPRYMVGINQNDSSRYTVYAVYPSEYGYNIIEICEFDDPIKSFDYVRLYTLAGSHYKTDIDLYKLIINYIDEKINCNDLILGAFVIYGYKEHPDFQNMVNTLNTFNFGYESPILKDSKQRDLPKRLREEIRDFRDMDTNHMFKLYSDLYDVIVKYDFFKDKSTDNINSVDLSSFIREISNIFISNFGMIDA